MLYDILVNLKKEILKYRSQYTQFLVLEVLRFFGHTNFILQLRIDKLKYFLNKERQKITYIYGILF